MANPEVDALDFEDDNLMDGDAMADVDASSSPRAPQPKLKSAITGGASKKTKGRGFGEGADSGPGPQRYTKEDARMVSPESNFADTSTFWGWFFIVMGSVFFLGFLFAAVISKLLPLSDNPILSSIQNDRYYCFLVPLTLPIIVVAVYFHWLSMKLFKHA